MENLTVKKEFILEVHKAACSEWKHKIEYEFPSLFKKQVRIIERKLRDSVEVYANEYFFSKGDVIKIVDGSYNKDVITGKNRHGIDNLFKSTAVIVGFSLDEWYQSSCPNISVTMNIIALLHDNTLIFVAPCCVEKVN